MANKAAIRAKFPKQPKFTVKQFITDVGSLNQSLAFLFLEFTKKRFEQKHYDFSVIEETITHAPIYKQELSDSITQDKEFVFIKDGKKVGNVGHKELFSVLEKGRLDKGIMPNPILRSCFEDFYPVYKKAVKDFLLRKIS